MRKITQIISGFAIILGVTACNSTPETNESESADTPAYCFYSYSEGASNFEFTAFKTTDRVGVKGGFNDITVESEKLDSPIAVLESITFSMKTSSVETNDESRNGKISKFFFETINTPTINGSIKSIDENGKAIIAVEMNGVTVDIEGEYTLEDRTFSFNSLIDVSSWNALAGITALNKECEDLHKGNDGVTKTWTEVELSFTTTLASDCE